MISNEACEKLPFQYCIHMINCIVQLGKNQTTVCTLVFCQTLGSKLSLFVAITGIMNKLAEGNKFLDKSWALLTQIKMAVFNKLKV